MWGFPVGTGKCIPSWYLPWPLCRPEEMATGKRAFLDALQVCLGLFKEELDGNLRCTMSAAQTRHTSPPQPHHTLQDHTAQLLNRGFITVCDILASLGFQNIMFKNLHTCPWLCSKKKRHYWHACAFLRSTDKGTSWSEHINGCPLNPPLPIFPLEPP